MAKDIAALSGGDKTAFRAALAGMFYMTPIGDGVTISSPVSYVDFTLPAGINAFILEVAGLRFSHADLLSIALSTDGATFLCDTDNGDTYAYGGFCYKASPNGSDTTGGTSNNKSLPRLNKDPFPATGDCVLPMRGEITIVPGSVSDYPILYAELNYQRNADGSEPVNFAFNADRFTATLNRDATVPPTLARVQKIRVMPNGNEDANPPTSSYTITAGTLNLYGIPA